MCPQSSAGDRSTRPRVLGSTAGFAPVVVVVLVVVLYSLLIVQQPLLGALVATWVVGLYLGWRFVTWFLAAYRQRTAAMEAMAESLDALADQGGPGSVSGEEE